MNKIKIDTETIKLDSFLKWCSAASSGAEAKIYIKNGMVKVNNEVCTMRGKKLIAGDIVSLDNEEYEVVCLMK